MPTTILTAQGVVQDGSQPVNAVPSVQVKTLAVGVDAQLNLNVVGSNGLPIDLTGAECVLSVKRFDDDLEPLIQRLAIVTNAIGGLAAFALSENDTIAIGAGSYIYDITIIFPSGSRVQVVPVSTLTIAASPSNPALLPTIQLPSQIGQGGHVLGTDGTNLEWVNTNGTFNPRGAWVGNVAYAVNDIVTNAGGVYRCKVPVTSNTPPGGDATHWELWAGSGVDPNTLLGSAALPVGGAWQELGRYTPGVNKVGWIDVRAKGQSSAKKRLRVWDQLCYRTDGAGNVFLQGNALWPIGGTAPTYNGALSPAAATAVGAIEAPNSGIVSVSWTNNGPNEVDGIYVEVSADGGATWTTVLYSLVAPSATAVDLPVDHQAPVTPSSDLKFRVVTFNDFGEARSAIVDLTTDASVQPVTPNNQPTTPDFPIGSAQYDDTLPYWLHLNQQPSGGGGTLQLAIVPVGTDVVVKARAQGGGNSGGISTRIEFSNGVAS